ncbi:MAG: hypothetical protein E7159_00785 [Firmicutes bacterium]|nr:hypothetical protein [Bacillota bacterium]
MTYTNKQIGNAALGTAIGYFTNEGYTVSIPLNDTQDYDLIVDIEGKLHKVQVKGTTFKTKYDVYQVSLKSSGGTKGKIYKTIKDTDVDLTFVACEDGQMFLIPKEALNNTSTLNLGKEYLEYRL